MKPSAEFVFFIIGLLPLGFFYGQLKAAFGSDLYFFLATISYLLLLRILGKALARTCRSSSSK